MRSRHALTAALALSVVTILTVAACGSSVQGSAQVNTAAAADTTAERTAATSIAAPTDLSELSSMLNDLSAQVPSELSDLSDIPIPTGLFDENCLAVTAVYADLAAAITLGSGIVDGQDLQDYQQFIDQYGGEVPAELAPDVQALKEVADEAKGKDFVALGELLSGEKYTTADAHIQAWITANCGG